MSTYRVLGCRWVWETAYIDIEDADSGEDAHAKADEYLSGVDEDSLHWSTGDTDSSAEVEGVTEVGTMRSARRQPRDGRAIEGNEPLTASSTSGCGGASPIREPR
jgi:hypothetical protein